jgi:probable F420-dependent oxidoreductase
MPRVRPSIVLSLSRVEENAEAARLAEAGGFESVWATEFYDRSATVALAAMAHATSEVELGSAIAYAFGRTPLVLAAEARDLDELSGGRLTLGLGTGTRRMQREWHGLDGEHPASRMEELVPLLRRLLRLHEGPLEHEGRFYTLRVRPTAPVAPPLREDLPIYMAGVNARMIEAAGAVGDGLVGHPLFTPDYTREVVRPALARGGERAGREEPVPVAGYVTCAVDPDGDQARRDAAAIIAFNSTVKTYEAIHRLHGWESHVEAIRSAWRAGDFTGMMEAVPREMVDAIAIAGTPDEIREQLAARAGLYERVLLWPPAFRGMDGARAVIEALGPDGGGGPAA